MLLIRRNCVNTVELLWECNKKRNDDTVINDLVASAAVISPNHNHKSWLPLFQMWALCSTVIEPQNILIFANASFYMIWPACMVYVCICRYDWSDKERPYHHHSNKKCQKHTTLFPHMIHIFVHNWTIYDQFHPLLQSHRHPTVTNIQGQLFRHISDEFPISSVSKKSKYANKLSICPIISFHFWMLHDFILSLQPFVLYIFIITVCSWCTHNLQPHCSTIWISTHY